MRHVKPLLVGLALGLLAAIGPSCGQAKKCDAKNCSNGCCDASGVCQIGNEPTSCGAAGNTCSVCAAGMTCSVGACVPQGNGTGGGNGGSGGGSAGTGGGMGGGSAMMMGTSCANAIPLPVGGTAATGKIDAAGKRVYYSIEMEANDVAVISTEANPNDMSDTLDTVVSLYNMSSGTPVLMATVDDAYPRSSSDTVLYHRFKTAGTYCLALEDFSSWVGQPSVPTTNDYSLAVRLFDPQGSASIVDTEPNNEVTAPQSATLFAGMSQSGVPFQVGILAGDLSSGTDVDVFKVSVANNNSIMMISMPPLGVPAAGKNGYGSGLPTIAVRVLKTDGTVLGAWQSTAATVATMPLTIDVPVSTGDVLVSIERPAGSTATDNDFYVTSIEIQPDNPAEMNDSTNGVISTPEALNFQVDPQDAKEKRAFILGTIGAGDTDYYAVPVTANQKVGLVCGALRTGSGLTATYEIVTSTDTSLQSETDVATRDIFWNDSSGASKPLVNVSADQTLLFKVTGTQDPVNTGNWYRCAVRVVSP